MCMLWNKFLFLLALWKILLYTTEVLKTANLYIPVLASFPSSLVTRPHPQGEGLVTSGWSLGLCCKFIACCMHSWEQITNLRAKSALSSHASCWSSQGFQVFHYRLWFLQRDLRREISLQKVINVNEAQGTSRTSPDPLLAGGVWKIPGSRSPRVYIFAFWGSLGMRLLTACKNSQKLDSRKA